MPPSRTQITTHDNLHISVAVHGESQPTTVLVHGWAVSGQIWECVAQRWNQPGRLLIPDLRGTGQSTRQATSHTIEDHGKDLIAMIETMADGPVDLVGHSMGGLISQWLATQRPDLLRSLTLVSPTPAGGVPFGPEDIAFFEALYDQPDQVIGSMIRTQPDPQALAACVQDVANNSRQAYVSNFKSWREASFAHALGTITTPTAVLGGEREEPLTPDLLQAAVVNLIPKATFTLIPGVGHYPQFEAPDAFTKLLQDTIPGR